MEESSARDYNLWANECSANADSISKQLFESLVGDEERHFDQFDDKINNRKSFVYNRLLLKSIERTKSCQSGGSGEYR